MKVKLIFLAGAATGFVLGSKAGRGAYEKIKAKATETWEDPKVQKGFESASGFVASQAPVVGQKLQDAASSVAGKVTKKAGKGKDSDSSESSSSSESSPASGPSAGSGTSFDSVDASADSGDVSPGSSLDDGDTYEPMTPATPAP
jgi:hypothetical protein